MGYTVPPSSIQGHLIYVLRLAFGEENWDLESDSDEVEEELSLLDAAEMIRHGKDTTGWLIHLLDVFSCHARTAWLF